MSDRDSFQERIGDGLVRIGAITQAQCDHVLQLQKAGDKRLFGEIALALGYVDFQSLMNYLNKKA